MSGKRFAELDLERREAILAAAAAEFASHGYQAASVNRIIAAADISKGSLYYYFEDKEDLFTTVVEQAAARMVADVGMPAAAALSAATFWNTLRDLMRRSVDLLDSDRWYGQLVRAFPRLRRDAPATAGVRRIIDRGRDQVRTLLARGQELEVVRRDLPLPLLVEATFAVDEAGDRWRLEHWEDSSPEERVTLAEAQMDLIRDMLHAKNEGWED